MKHLTRLIAALAITAWAIPAPAQDAQRTYDRVDFNVTAEREVENDVLVAIVYSEAEDNDQADAADEVNANIRWAADRARRASDVELQTLQYTTRPVYAPNSRRIVGWIARQSLRLESRAPAALSTLLGDLQARVALQSLNYDLSKAARDTAEDELIREALSRFNRRAALIADEMDRSGYRLVNVNVNTGGPIAFARAQRAEFQVADVAAPEIAAGTQTLSVTANGAIELAPAARE
jgi:predicted secreted protein